MYGNSLYYLLNFSVYLNLLWKNKVLFCFCFFQYSLMQTGRPGQSCFTQQAGHLSGSDPLCLPALLSWPGPTAAKPSHGCETTAAVSVRPADMTTSDKDRNSFSLSSPVRSFLQTEGPGRFPLETTGQKRVTCLWQSQSLRREHDDPQNPQGTELPLSLIVGASEATELFQLLRSGWARGHDALQGTPELTTLRLVWWVLRPLP